MNLNGSGVRSAGGLAGTMLIESELSLKRLMPRLEAVWQEHDTDSLLQWEFNERLDEHWHPLFGLLRELYGERYDFFYHLDQILCTTAQAWATRPESLRQVDRQRLNQPDWFASEKIVGGALYVDLFSDNLSSLREQIGYFQKLGLTYLHLMPLFAVRPGDSDGGYAISDYRAIDPKLGTIEDLRLLADDLREAGIVLVLDFVFNHTSDDHDWAKRAQSGDVEYQQFYYIFPDREQPDRYEATLREIFPTVRRGNFSWHDGMQQWVWTTFNSFQWDLNYHNPAVFRSMLEELFFIASTGIDILRLDAVAFIWKEMGTGCENLPKAHKLIQAFTRLTNIGTPGLIFKSEAIVHPDEVVKYVSEQECQISYNPTLMALLWESLATTKVQLLARSLGHRHRLPKNTAWVNYLRCHDDIGWTFDDGDAAALGINAFDHRRFLNQFYTGQHEGSFARGIPFQENVQTGDMRVAGTLASLAGLEQAIEQDNEREIELAIRRMLLLQGITLSIGGIPLIYLGEEWGMLNDYNFINDPAKAGDTRWVHRPKMNWDFVRDLDAIPESRESSVRRIIFESMQRMIETRKSQPALAGQKMDLVNVNNPHVLSFIRSVDAHRLIVLANFSDQPQKISGNILRTAGMGRFFEDTITRQSFATSDDLTIEAYQILWLLRT